MEVNHDARKCYRRAGYDCRGALVSQEKYNTIDRVLARHYGFSDEELDYLINYDIKYRLRADDGEDG